MLGGAIFPALRCLSEVLEAQEDLLGGRAGVQCGASSLEELYKPGQGIAARALHCPGHPWQGRGGKSSVQSHLGGFGEQIPPAALFGAFP